MDISCNFLLEFTEIEITLYTNISLAKVLYATKIQLNEINTYNFQLMFLSQMDASAVQILSKVPEDLTSYI